MSTEPTDTTPTTEADNRSGDVPHGGFAPIVDLPEAASVATMPPPPVAAGTWIATAVEPEAGEELPEETSGHFPPTAFPASVSTATTADEADDEADDEVDSGQDPVDRVEPAVEHSDDGVVFFGDAPDPTPRSGWVSDDDSDLILPIEPARLRSAAPPASLGVVVDTGPGPDDADDDPAGLALDAIPQHDSRLDVAAPHVVDVRAVLDLAYDRVRRALGTAVGTLVGFFEDEATEITLRPPSGPIVCLAGSELAGVADEPSDLFGTSLELGVPHHVPLGIAIPVHLVTAGPAASTTGVGDIVITAVGGALEVTPQLGDGIAEEIVKAFARDVTKVSDEIDRRREAHEVVITALTLDSGGAIRIEVERR